MQVVQDVRALLRLKTLHMEQHSFVYKGKPSHFSPRKFLQAVYSLISCGWLGEKLVLV